MSAITVGTLAITRRKQLPFGQLRSSQSTAFGNRGFAGGTNDPTGLTHLGAREYDPTLGRFLSVDPIIDTADPAQMNAYSYAHNSPLIKSDPDGLRPDGPAGGASYNDDRWAADRGMNAGYTYKSGKWVCTRPPNPGSIPATRRTGQTRVATRYFTTMQKRPPMPRRLHFDLKKPG
ncbi:RHS repeat-associated core domain-containing protein [Streptomyces sp. NPDC091387]|uniref:RHS repeat-associated core domain-containing protein n=1 Tax=Streptomyces sp. NPDC091387 TaxID=3365998 RepID=UPI0037F99F05